MKKNGIISLLGITILLLILLAGCTAMAAEQKLDAIEETIEQQLDAAEDAAEVMVLDILTTDPPAPPATEAPAAQPPAPEAAAMKLTADEAKAVALAHAGFAADQVTWLRAEYEIDDRIPEYEIEFNSGDTEYDYTIHAETGEIRHWDKDYDPPRKTTPATQPTATEPPATEPPATKKLTADEAKAVALAHAGFNADQVTWLRAEYEIDDRIPEYEIEFHSGDTEYDYTIHAETGEIHHWDKEYDPPKKIAQTTEPPATEPPATEAPAVKKLTADEAKAVALAHAGFSADQVSGLRAEYDVDDRVPVYEVEFHKDRWEYDYEIHAETGKILSYDKGD